MIGKFRFVEALHYPYKHYVPAIIMPGAIVYAETALWIGLILLAIVMVFAVAASMGLDLSMLPGASQATALLAQLPFVSGTGADEPIAMLAANAAESSDTSSWSDLSSANSNFNFGGAGPFYYLLWCGYEWRLYGHWQKHGLNAAPPVWHEGFMGIVGDGLKGAAFYGVLRVLILSIVLLPVVAFVIGNWETVLTAFHELSEAMDESAPPDWFIQVFLGVIGFFILFSVVDFFLAPFFIAPLMHSAQNRTLGALFNWDKTMAIGARHYTDVIVSFFLIGVTLVMYVVGGIIVGFATCCIGFLLFPFLFNGAFRTTAAHLLAQAYELSPQTEPTTATEET